jgi:metallophosphoesterase superfamily enzyme
LHFGEEDSLLTNLKEGSHDLDASRPSMKHLVECLKYLIFQNETDKKPVLILNGDILELALSTTNQAAMVFQRFIELILPSNTALFEKIIYIPGNHDHNIWEIARETQYMDYISKFTSEDYLPIPWHTTKLFIENPSICFSAGQTY